MTVYYVGPGGSDASPGLNWSNRKLTLNGAEDVPVKPGDTVYVGPGIYREQLTVDVNGESGNVITYIADPTGKQTDGVGGEVIVSGSNADTVCTRNTGIYASGKSYRTFVSFHMEGHKINGLHFANGCTNIILLDIAAGPGGGLYSIGANFEDSYTNIEVTRCFLMGTSAGLRFSCGSDQTASGVTVSDCLLMANNALPLTNLGGVVIQNCTMLGAWRGVYLWSTPSSSTFRNCVINGGYYGVYAQTAGRAATTYCLVHAGSNNYNWSAGTGDVQYMPQFKLPMLTGTHNPIRYPMAQIGELNSRSYAARATGTSETATDLYGLARPVTSSKSSWGAIQFYDSERETGTVRSGTASFRFSDASRYQLFVPVQLQHIRIAVYVYREADYTGTNPQMIIREPGEAPRITTDAGADEGWNLLEDDFNAKSDYVIVELVSNNTAAAGNFAVFFDDMDAQLA